MKRRRHIYMVVAIFMAIIFFTPHLWASAKSELKKFDKFIQTLDREYIDDLDYNYLMEVAIRAILDQTDPYSIYLNREDSRHIETIIDSPAIDTTYMLNGSTMCIKVGLFSRDTAADIERSYSDSGSPTNLILDLRGNKGGLVSEAIRTSNLFLRKGAQIFRRDRRGRIIATHTAQYDGGLLQTNVIVVIDSESASASEIVAAALQFNKGGVIVGQRSFGKGLIISPFVLPDSSVVWISTAQYTTPIGGKIQRSYRGRESSDDDGGVIPDVKFESNEPITNEDFVMFCQSNN